MRITPSTVAVVTGVASGIGRALALRLARAGATLALNDVSEAGLGETAEAVRALGAKCSAHAFDVADEAKFKNFADDILRRYGRASLLVNNAGVALHGTVGELSTADIEWLMGVNFWGTVYGVKYFLPILKEQPEAHVVNVSSVFGLIAPPGHAAYAASKFAVRGFTESLRHELAGTKVKVSCVHPGGIKTRIARNARVGAHAPRSSADEEIARFERVARTTAEAAAERIVRGVERDEERILIGSDARFIELTQRLRPVRYWRLLDAVLRKMAD
jgi:NAD(P)-dependent dehydrogenase (short-subunit alcohol dehydrogenase family)